MKYEVFDANLSINSANVFQMKYPKNCDIFHYDFEPLDPRLKKEDKREFFRTFAKSNKHIFKVRVSI